MQHIVILSSWYPNKTDLHVGNFVEKFAHLLTSNYTVSVWHFVSTSDKKVEVSVKTHSNGLNETIYYVPKKLKRIYGIYLFLKSLRKIKIDYIFAHAPITNGYLVYLIKKITGAPLLILEHGTYFRKEYHFSYKEKLNLKLAYNNSDYLCAVSHFLADEMKGKMGLKRKIHVIGNVVDSKIFQLNPSERKFEKIIHISTLNPKLKRPQYILDAFEELYKKYPNIALVIVTDQPTTEWKTYISGFQSRSAIQFKGPLNTLEISELIQNSDALIHASTYETYGITYIEALLCGTPIIGTKTGILHDLKDQKIGSLVPSECDYDQFLMNWEKFLKEEVKINPENLRNSVLHLENERILKELNNYFKPNK